MVQSGHAWSENAGRRGGATGMVTRRAAASVLVLCGLFAALNSWGETTAEVLWGYEGKRGPAHWGSLDQSFSACAEGTEQSPVDLVSGTDRDYPAIKFDYGPRLAMVANNGHTIQVNLERGDGITLDGTRFELLQFHFHHGSEHTLDGAQLPMEMHLVHRSDRGALAVIGVLLGEGAAHEALAPIWERLPSQANWAVALPEEIDVMALLPKPRTAWRYRGSLTTPPCTEGVSWIVMSKPVTLSAAQITKFGALHPRNFRPPQPLRGRTLGRE